MNLGLQGLVLCIALLILGLVGFSAIAVTASFTGWEPILSKWPYAVTAIISLAIGIYLGKAAIRD